MGIHSEHSRINMNCCGGETIDPEAQEQSRKIDADMKKQRKRDHDTVRLLLLGAGESGKSTVAKQMKIIHQESWTEEERKNFVMTIHQNIYDSLKAMIAFCQDQKLK